MIRLKIQGQADEQVLIKVLKQAGQRVRPDHKALLENYRRRSFQWDPKLGDSLFECNPPLSNLKKQLPLELTLFSSDGF